MAIFVIMGFLRMRTAKTFFSQQECKKKVLFILRFLKNFHSVCSFISAPMFLFIVLQMASCLNAPFRRLCLLSRRERSGVTVGGHPRLRHHQAEAQWLVSLPANLETRGQILTGRSWRARMHLLRWLDSCTWMWKETKRAKQGHSLSM